MVDRKAKTMWMFRNTPPLVIAAVLSKIMTCLTAIVVFIITIALPALLFFNGGGLGAR